MAITNQERVGKAMELLKAGLAPFVEREFKKHVQGSRRRHETRCDASATIRELASKPIARVGRGRRC